MEAEKLSALTVTEYNLIANKDPLGSYDRSTRDHLYAILAKLHTTDATLSPLEIRLKGKFQNARFLALEDKDRRVKREVVRYRLSSRVKNWIKGTALAVLTLVFAGLLTYHLILDSNSRHEVDVAWYAGLNRVGLVSKEELSRIKKDLTIASTSLKKTRQEYLKLARTVEQMILNNKVTENLKYILKQIYNDPRARYVKKSGKVELMFGDRELARYDTDPAKWYLLGVIESGLIRVYYNNDQILEIEAIFGRKGEETPVGEYEIKNKAYKPTWYKKEEVDGRTRVRAIKFGDPDHEIGHWWLGLRPLGDPVPGSYGIHGVNISKYNEFFKKNFDWRNGSAGCPNVQEWYLEFLGRMVPVGTKVNIVEKEKWVNNGATGGQLVGSL